MSATKIHNPQHKVKPKVIEIQSGASLNNGGKRILSSRDVFKNLLEQMKPVNFRDALQLDEKDKIPQKFYVVAVVDEILRIAAENTWDLCVKNGFVYAYNGAFWQAADREELKVFLGEAAELLGYNKNDARHYKFRNELYNQFLAVANFPAPEPEPGKVFINLQNGTLEVSQTGFELREHRKQDFLTYVLSFDYNETADCPLFLTYLHRVLPDISVQKVLKEFIAYVFTTHLKLEKCLLLYGTGANGKSVFFDVMNALLGRENVSNFSLANLGEEHNRALIVNKLLNYGSEIRGSIEADIFKQLASGEPIQARLKYGNSFTAEKYAKLCFNANELPRDVEHTNAYFRRFLIIPFSVTIPEAEQDKQLASKIIADELPGVLNWVLLGLSRLLSQGRFSDCEACEAVLESYKLESDTVALFLSENNYKKSITERRTLQSLYCDYRLFCSDNGNKMLNLRNFAARLRNMGYETQKANVGQIVFIEKNIAA